MKTYTLKEKYEGLVITRHSTKVNGSVTFNANEVSPLYYENYHNVGFEDMFDVVDMADKKASKPTGGKASGRKK